MKRETTGQPSAGFEFYNFCAYNKSMHDPGDGSRDRGSRVRVAAVMNLQG
jgi:hypothetical protein